MVQQILVQKEENKRISILKEIRKDLFYYKKGQDSWKHTLELRVIKKYDYLQNLIRLNEDDLNKVVNAYKKWVSLPTYLVFKDKDDNLLMSLASKRGNKIYDYYVRKRLKESLKFMEKKNFGKYILRDKKGTRKNKLSNVMFITLSTDPKYYGSSRLKAWLNIEKNYNIFITRLRKKYGRCWVMKANESHKNGYPHIHLLVVTEKSFEVFPHKNKKNFLEYRIKDKNIIQSYWNSYIDVIVPNLYGIKKGNKLEAMQDYIFKDMLKSYNYKANKGYKNQLSLSLGWIFGKRCYSVSKSGVADDLINDTSIIQTQIKDIIDKNKEKELVYIGMLDIDYKNGVVPPPCFLWNKEK